MITINRIPRRLQEHQYTTIELSREIQGITQPVPLFRTIHDTYEATVRNYESNFWVTYYSLLDRGIILHNLDPTSISRDIELFEVESVYTIVRQ